jgi:cardiolipin synthase (CMP-forming)
LTSTGGSRSAIEAIESAIAGGKCECSRQQDFQWLILALPTAAELPGMTIPNFITIGRLILVPLVIVMIVQGQWGLAFALFVLAGLSDAVDGFIARRFDMRSELGTYLDPVADKALLVSIYVTLAIIGIIPAWMAILVVSRDIMIVSAVILSWVLDNPVEMRPLLVSKLNTFAQIAFAAALLAAKTSGISLGFWFDAAIWSTAALTLASTGAYLSLWLKHMAS